MLAVSDDKGGEITVDPTIVEADRARSVHVLGFTSDDELLLSESAGSFSVDEWGKVLEKGQRICCEQRDSGLDTAMEGGGIEARGVKDFIRSVMETKLAADLQWK